MVSALHAPDAPLLPGMPLFNPAQSSVDHYMFEKAFGEGGGLAPDEAEELDDPSWWVLGCQATLDMRAQEAPWTQASRRVEATGKDEVLHANEAWLHAYLKAWRESRPWQLMVTVEGRAAATTVTDNFVDFAKDHMQSHPASAEDLEAAEGTVHIQLTPSQSAAPPRGSTAPHVIRQVYSLARWHTLVGAWEATAQCGSAHRAAELGELCEILRSEEFANPSVAVELVRPDAKTPFGFTFEHMALVDVVPGSPAAARGLLRHIGRRVWQVDARRVTDVTQLYEYLAGRTRIVLHLRLNGDEGMGASCGQCTELSDKVAALEARLRVASRPHRAWDPQGRLVCRACHAADLMPWVEVCPSCGTPVDRPAALPPPPPPAAVPWRELACPACYVLFAAPFTSAPAVCPWCTHSWVPATADLDTTAAPPPGTAVVCRVCAVPVHAAACPLCGLPRSKCEGKSHRA